VTVEPQEFTRMFFLTALGTTAALLAGGAIARGRATTERRLTQPSG
jgi:hypothetical protein